MTVEKINDIKMVLQKNNLTSAGTPFVSPEKFKEFKAMQEAGELNTPLIGSNLQETPSQNENDLGLLNLMQNTEIGDVVANQATQVGQMLPQSAQNLGNEAFETVSDYTPDWIKKTYGIGEAVASFGSGALSTIPATVGFYTEMSKAWGDKTFVDSLNDATKTYQNIMGSMTFTPRTEAGKDLTTMVSLPFLALENASTAAGETMMNIVGGSSTGLNKQQQALAQDFKLIADEIQSYRDNNETVPRALIDSSSSMRLKMMNEGIFDANAEINNSAIFSGATLKGFIDLFPDIYMQGNKVIKNREMIKEFRSTMDEYGIDIAGVTDSQIKQWNGLIKDSQGNAATRFQGMTDFQTQLKNRKESIRQQSKQLYQAAENEVGYFNGLELKQFSQRLAALGKQEDWVNTSPQLAPLLQELEKIIEKPNVLLPENKPPLGYPSSQTIPPKGGVMINEQGAAINDLWNFRAKINKQISLNIKSKKPENVAYARNLLSVKDQIDGFMTSQFEANTLANGESMFFDKNKMANASLAKWKKANKFYIDYQNNFNSQQVVRKLLDADVSAKKVVNMILGFNAANFKDNAASVVSTLQNIFPDIDGIPSPQMEAIKAEMKMAVFADLIVPEIPNVTAFESKYRKWKSMNTEVNNLLFSREEMKQMDLVYKSAQAQARVAEKSVIAKGVNPAEAATELNNVTGRFVALSFAGEGAKLARAGFKMGLLQSMWKKMSGAVNRITNAELTGEYGRDSAGRRQIMSQIYGEDLRRPLRSLNVLRSFENIKETRIAEEMQNGNAEESLERMDAPPILQRQFSQDRYAQ